MTEDILSTRKEKVALKQKPFKRKNLENVGGDFSPKKLFIQAEITLASERWGKTFKGPQSRSLARDRDHIQQEGMTWGSQDEGEVHPSMSAHSRIFTLLAWSLLNPTLLSETKQWQVYRK